MGKTKYLSAFERGMVVGARRTGLCQELHRWLVFHTQQFPACIKNGPPPGASERGHTHSNREFDKSTKSCWAALKSS